MKLIPRLFPQITVLCLALVLPAVVFADDWRSIDPAEMALKAPVVEKDADAEAIFWEVRVDDSQFDQLAFNHHLRVKVFTDRGKESQSKVDLQYSNYSRIKDIAARVIKPDGTTVELKKDDIFDRTLVKLSGLKVKTKSFALPGIEPGAIVEYRWREVFPGGSANRLRLHFQREIPVQNVSYYLKPFAGMGYQAFRMGEAKFVKDKGNFYRMTMNNVKAFREEPRMPPENEVRSWVFLFYTDQQKPDTAKYWKDVSNSMFEATRDRMKANDVVRNAIVGIVGDAATPEAKLQRIYDFCRTEIKNTSDDASGLSADEKEKLKDNKSPADTLKNKRGTGGDIDMLFGALAKAAGFDARFAMSGNRDEMIFDRTLANSAFLGAAFIAVQVGEKWQFFSPAEMYTPFGMLGWPEEGQEVLITDSKAPIWANSGIAPPEQSVEKRTGKFQLLPDGALEGDVRIEYTGHLGAEKKEFNDDDSPAQREETLRESVKRRMSTAELSDIKIENVTDPIKPFAYAYHVRVPGYAQKTGKRLFLQPGFFEHGGAPLFTASSRQQSIVFRYTWSEEDIIEISLPEGFSLDNADAPYPIEPAATQHISGHIVKMSATTDGRKMFYRRKFFFGGKDSIMFPVNSYGGLKQLFDGVHKNDNHTVTLKQTATTASN
jgi:hypothetical protein